MKLSYEPGRVVGGSAALLLAALALLVYYDVLDTQGAGLWAAFLTPLVPILQAEIARRFTWSAAKIADAARVDPGMHPEAIEDKAKIGRNRRHAAKASATGAGV